VLRLHSKVYAPRKRSVGRGAEESGLPLLVLGSNVSRSASERNAAVCTGEFKVLLCQEVVKARVLPARQQFEILEVVVRTYIVLVVDDEPSGYEGACVLPVHEVVFENPTARLVARAGVFSGSTDEAVGRSHTGTYPRLLALQRAFSLLRKHIN